MKHKLKRIKSTLRQLDQQQQHLQTHRSPTSVQSTSSPQTVLHPTPPPSPAVFSFKIEADTAATQSVGDPIIPVSIPGTGSTATPPVQPFSVLLTAEEAPILPKLQVTSLGSYSTGVNPDLVRGILQEIQTTLGQWQQELEGVLQQIQTIYKEGPMIEGWLESDCSNSADPVSVRHADPKELMEYVEDVCDPRKAGGAGSGYRAAYRLCGLDSSGQQWEKPCPPDQVASVSLAIARYQKLRQLLDRKFRLEDRLNQFAQSLIALHGQLH